MFRKFDDEEVEMVVFMHVDDILAHAQATMERFAGELGENDNDMIAIATLSLPPRAISRG